MQLLVDIPEEEADIPKEDYYQVALTKIMLMCFGCRVTKLPKGHGRLIDADALTPKIHGTKSIIAVLDAPTIIEADKEASE